MSNFFPQTPPATPPATPPRTPILPRSPVSSNNDDSQYSSDYNDEWDNYMNNPNVTRRRARVSNDEDEDDFIQGRELLMSDLNGRDSDQEEEEEDSQFSQGSQQEEKKEQETWASGEMPPIPNYPKQIIDVNAEGFDPILMDKQNVEEYLKENKQENVAILCNGKIYLSTRGTIDQQAEEALVYECIEGDKKRKNNVIGNLPLFNIKKIGIDLSSDNAVGVESEYIYMDGIDDLLMSESFWQYYSIIPLPDKQLVSVISKNEAFKIGTNLGSGYGALHCQAGQGGLAGIIVKAYPSNSTDTIGGKKKRKTMKKRKTAKKRKTMKKRKMVTLKKKTNKKRKSGTKKRN